MISARAANPPLPTAPQFLELPGGARLAYAESGDPAGTPVILCHGWPASRLECENAAEAARKTGVRVICPDRPGIGLSTFQPNRRLLDWPPVIAALADHLGLERFRVAGLSGGAPYAFATAWALPERVAAIAIVCGAPPLPSGVDLQTLLPVYRLLLRLHRRHPGFVRALFRAARPIVTVHPPHWTRSLLLKITSSADAALLAAPAVFDQHFKVYREAWHGSGAGVAADAEIYNQDWGFHVEDLCVPIQLWHGKEDRNFAWKLAEALAKRLPQCTAHFIESEGHSSLPHVYWPEILRDLAAAGEH